MRGLIIGMLAAVITIKIAQKGGIVSPNGKAS